LAFFDLNYKIVFFKTFGSLFVRKNLLHCETGFGVYRSTQLDHIPFFLLLYLLVGPSIGVVGLGEDDHWRWSLGEDDHQRCSLREDDHRVWSLGEDDH
jgi:hypothetical protein